MRAVDLAKETLRAVATPQQASYIPFFLSAIACRPTAEGFILEIRPPDPRFREPAQLDVRGIPNLPLFTAIFSRSDVQAWEIIYDWVVHAKELKEMDGEEGEINHERIANRIFGILFAPHTDQQFAAREQLLKSGDPNRVYLLDFAAAGYAAGDYGINNEITRTWLAAVGKAWEVMAVTELPSRMVQEINATMKMR